MIDWWILLGRSIKSAGCLNLFRIFLCRLLRNLRKTGLFSYRSMNLSTSFTILWDCTYEATVTTKTTFDGHERLRSRQYNTRNTQHRRATRISNSRSYPLSDDTTRMNIMIARREGRERSICLLTPRSLCLFGPFWSGQVWINISLDWAQIHFSTCGILDHLRNLLILCSGNHFCMYSRHRHIGHPIFSVALSLIEILVFFA